MTVLFGVRHLLNTDPPFSNSTCNFTAGYSSVYSDPIGPAFYRRGARASFCSPASRGALFWVSHSPRSGPGGQPQFCCAAHVRSLRPRRSILQPSCDASFRRPVRRIAPTPEQAQHRHLSPGETVLTNTSTRVTIFRRPNGSPSIKTTSGSGSCPQGDRVFAIWL